MRALFVTNPGIGHLRPMLPIAHELQRSGHEVAFACGSAFRTAVEDRGFGSFPAGLDWLESNAEDTFPRLKAMTLDDMELSFLSDVFAGPAARQMCPDLLDLCEAWRPEILLANDYEFSTHIVAERTGIPHATIGLGVYLPGRALSAIIGQQIAELRERHGLPHDPDLAGLHGELYFSWYPRSYHFPDAPLPVGFHALREPTSGFRGSVDPPEWLESLKPGATVLATLGTVFNRRSEAEEIFRTIVDGLQDEPIDLVLTVGPGQDPERLGTTPSNVRVVSFVPHTLVLPFCSLAITQGGSGTTRAALRRGLPVIVIPLNGEDVFHAMRVAALRLGCVVRRRGQFDSYLGDRDSTLLSPATIRSAMRRIAQSPECRRNARHLAGEMGSLPEPRHAVGLLEQSLAERRR